MSEVEKIERLTEGLKKYVNTSFELNKLEFTESASDIGANLISNFIIAVTALLFLLFISIAAGFYLSFRLGNNYSGFIIVAGFYLLIVLILFLCRKKYLERTFRDKITLIIFNKIHKT